MVWKAQWQSSWDLVPQISEEMTNNLKLLRDSMGYLIKGCDMNLKPHKYTKLNLVVSVWACISNLSLPSSREVFSKHQMFILLRNAFLPPPQKKLTFIYFLSIHQHSPLTMQPRHKLQPKKWKSIWCYEKHLSLYCSFQLFVEHRGTRSGERKSLHW